MPKRPEGSFVVSGAKATKPTNMYWPEIRNLEQAVQASNMGVAAALFVAGVNTLIATISTFQHAAVMGVTAAGYVDAALFALAAWGIWRRSRVAAIAGLCLFLAEKIYQFATQPKAALGLLVALALLALFISGVRGTFAYHGFSSVDASGANPDPGA